jgi:hypothetical protein
VRCHGSMKEEGLYDFVVVNDDLEEAFKKLQTIATAALAGKGSEDVADLAATLSNQVQPFSKPRSFYIIETIRTHCPIDLQNRNLGPCLTTINRILISVMRGSSMPCPRPRASRCCAVAWRMLP